MNDILIIEEEYTPRLRQNMITTYAEPYNGLDWSLVIFGLLALFSFIAWILAKNGEKK